MPGWCDVCGCAAAASVIISHTSNVIIHIIVTFVHHQILMYTFNIFYHSSQIYNNNIITFINVFVSYCHYHLSCTSLCLSLCLCLSLSLLSCSS